MNHIWNLIWGLFQELKENTLKEILLIIFIELEENILKETLLIMPLKKVFIDNTS